MRWGKKELAKRVICLVRLRVNCGSNPGEDAIADPGVAQVSLPAARAKA